MTVATGGSGYSYLWVVLVLFILLAISYQGNNIGYGY